MEIENLSEALDLYVQAGDVVKGGRRDRTLGVDFVLPAKSGRVSVPSFCVESGRWHRRAREESGSFSSSKSYLASKKLRMAAKMSKSQADRAAGGGITGVQSRIAAVTALGVVVIIVQVCIAALNEGGRAERSWKAQITGAPGRIPSKSLSLSQAAR